MNLPALDFGVIVVYFVVTLLMGWWFSRNSGGSIQDFFLSGRKVPWWLLGVSMVATTFSADTPNLVTQLVREKGVSGNWLWWCFLITGMCTVFIYAKLWRRSGVFTDLSFYELRYGGRGAAILRGFRAVYLGLFFNVMIMASVCLAALKIFAILWPGYAQEALFIGAGITLVYSLVGGLRGVIIIDFFQFFLAMVATIAAAVYLIDLPEIGGLSQLLEAPNVQERKSWLPAWDDSEAWVGLIILPLAVQWWSVWYPGAEPGGGGYIAQRMLSAKTEKHALWATLAFNLMHYALRPWPWILIALASLVLFPELSDLQAAFPQLDAATLNHDLAFPAMLTFLPEGLFGLMLAALMAAFMSTLSTHLNWGASYLIHDCYQRFYRPDASQRELIFISRLCIFFLALLSCLLALQLESALQAFQILLQIGAGTGLLFLLRWFWVRINVWSEIAAMLSSFIIALVLEIGFGTQLEAWLKMLIGVGSTTYVWIVVTLMTAPESDQVLISFYKRVRPSSRSWRSFMATQEPSVDLAEQESDLARSIWCMFLGIFATYALLFGTGQWLYGQTLWAIVLWGFALISGGLLYRQFRLLQFS
ncbi:MAG: sodium:solute symporter family protein [Flavobacteriaceae bacterium]